MKRRAFGAALTLGACARRAPTALDSLTTGLTARLPKLLERHRVPGVSLALVKDAALVWSRGFGVTRAGTNLPVRTGTIFEAGALGMPVFTYAVLKSCERGLLALDTPLVRYGAPRPLEGDPRLDQITARHVLTHSSGLPDWRSDGEPLAIAFPPGTRYLYSGEGFAYLQSVVLRVTGQPFEPFMEERVFLPFGMRTAGYLWKGTRRALTSFPHDAAGRPLENPGRTPDSVARYGAARDLMCTASDYARFLIELLAPKPADAFHLTPATLREMFRPQVPVGDQKGSSRGLGWQIFSRGQKSILAQAGGVRGFHSFAMAAPDGQAALVVMTNGENGALLVKELAEGGLNAFVGWHPAP